MKILIVNCVYGQGSTGKIIADLRRSLQEKRIDTVICYARGAKCKEAKTFRLASNWIMKIQSFLSKLSGYGYSCAPWSTKRLLSIVDQECPDIVNLHCVNANTINIAQVLNFLKLRKVTTVVSLHAEFLFTGGCAYALDCNQWITGCCKCPQFKTPNSNLPKSYFWDRSKYFWNQLNVSYKNFDNLSFTCVSPWLANRVNKSPMSSGHSVITVLNGLNTNIFRPRNYEHLKLRHQLTDEKIILHVTPDFYSPLKGGSYLIEFAKQLLDTDQNVRIIIVGYNGNGHDLPSNVIPVHYTRNQEELAEYYTMADITLLTSKKETFSMICAESLCCGTPMIGFYAGGPESISLPDFSRFVEYGNIEALLEAAIKWLNSTVSKTDIAQQAHAKYSIESMSEGYLAVYHQLLRK